MTSEQGQKVVVERIFISPGHDFRGRHGSERRSHVVETSENVELVAGSGIVGDRFFDYQPDFKGQITFFDRKVWEEVKQEFGIPNLCPSRFRRNVLLTGADLNSLIGKRFSLGDLEFTGSEEATPCYWMDEACAAAGDFPEGKVSGVEQFLKGKGGVRCRILRGGFLCLGEHQLSLMGAI